MDKLEIIARVNKFIKSVMVPAQYQFYRHIDMNDEPQRQAFEERKKDLEAMQNALMIIKASDDSGEVKFSKEFFEVLYYQSLLEYIQKNKPNKAALSIVFGNDAEKIDRLYELSIRSEYNKFKDFYKVLFNEDCKFTVDKIIKDLKK